MAGRASLVRAEPGFSLPFFDRLAPAPPPALVAARIEAHSGPGDVVLDLAGRGGWVAHAAIDRQRRAVSLESSPLTRLLAELVLRPPDLRHLDAAFQAMGASPRRQTSLKVAVGELFATRCATCERMLVADEFIWPGAADADATPTATATASGRAADARQAPSPQALPLPGLPRPARRLRAADGAARRRRPRARPRRRPRTRTSPAAGCATASRSSRAATALVDGLLDLHTPRQLVGLEAILDRIEGDLRAAPVEAALRLAFLHALLPASRLNGYPGPDRDAPDPGRPRPAAGRRAVARAQPVARVRGRDPASSAASSSGSRAGPCGAVQARLGDGPPEPRRRDARPRCSAWPGRRRRGAIGAEASRRGRGWDGVAAADGLPRPGPARARPAAGPPEPGAAVARPTGRRPGRSAARRRRSSRSRRCPAARSARRGAGRPRRSAGRSRRSSRRSPATAGSSSSSTAAPRRSSRRRSAASGRLPARLAPGSSDGDDEVAGSVELVPPGAVAAARAADPGERRRSTRCAGGAGDPDIVPGAGLFVAPGAVRPPAVLRGRRRANRRRRRGRDAQGARRAGPLRAAARRDPRRARPGRPAPAAASRRDAGRTATPADDGRRPPARTRRRRRARRRRSPAAPSPPPARDPPAPTARPAGQPAPDPAARPRAGAVGRDRAAARRPGRRAADQVERAPRR